MMVAMHRLVQLLCTNDQQVVPHPMQHHFQATNDIVNASARSRALEDCNNVRDGDNWCILSLPIQLFEPFARPKPSSSSHSNAHEHKTYV